MDTLQDVIVGLLFGAVVFGVALNAAYMLVSPRVWRRLPSWLRAKGQLGEGSYSVGWRAWLVRITGAILLGALVWMAYDALVRR